VPLTCRLILSILLRAILGRAAGEGARVFLEVVAGAPLADREYVKCMIRTMNALLHRLSGSLFGASLPHKLFKDSGKISDNDDIGAWSGLPGIVSLQGSLARPLLFSFTLALMYLPFLRGQLPFVAMPEFARALARSSEFAASAIAVYRLAYQTRGNAPALGAACINYLRLMREFDLGIFEKYMSTPNGNIFVGLPICTLMFGNLVTASTIRFEYENAIAKKQTARSNRAGSTSGLSTFQQQLKDHDLEMRSLPNLVEAVDAKYARLRAARAIPRRFERVQYGQRPVPIRHVSSHLSRIRKVDFALPNGPNGRRILRDFDFSLPNIVPVVYDALVSRRVLQDNDPGDLVIRTRFRVPGGGIVRTIWDSQTFHPIQGSASFVEDDPSKHSFRPRATFLAYRRPFLDDGRLIGHLFVELLGAVQLSDDVHAYIWLTYLSSLVDDATVLQPRLQHNTQLGPYCLGITHDGYADVDRLGNSSLLLNPPTLIHSPSIAPQRSIIDPPRVLCLHDSWKGGSTDDVILGDENDWEIAFGSSQIYLGVSAAALGQLI